MAIIIHVGYFYNFLGPWNTWTLVVNDTGWPTRYQIWGEMMQRIFVILPGQSPAIYHLNVTVMTLPTSHSNANSNPKLLDSEIFLKPRWPSVLDILPNLSMSYLNNGLVILLQKVLHWTKHFNSIIQCNISIQREY